MDDCGSGEEGTVSGLFPYRKQTSSGGTSQRGEDALMKTTKRELADVVAEVNKHGRRGLGQEISSDAGRRRGGRRRCRSEMKRRREETNSC